MSKQAKAIQTLLGDHQDSVVSRKHLIQQADAAHAAGEDTFTYGLLHQQEAELAESGRQQLDAALRKLDKSVRKRADAGDGVRRGGRLACKPDSLLVDKHFVEVDRRFLLILAASGSWPDPVAGVGNL